MLEPDYKTSLDVMEAFSRRCVAPTAVAAVHPPDRSLPAAAAVRQSRPPRPLPQRLAAGISPSPAACTTGKNRYGPNTGSSPGRHADCGTRTGAPITDPAAAAARCIPPTCRMTSADPRAPPPRTPAPMAAASAWQTLHHRDETPQAVGLEVCGHPHPTLASQHQLDRPILPRFCPPCWLTLTHPGWHLHPPHRLHVFLLAGRLARTRLR